jgi:hypothetical protein
VPGHGASAESAGWSGVIGRLLSRGHPVIAVANPLRGVRTDAADREAVPSVAASTAPALP